MRALVALTIVAAAASARAETRPFYGGAPEATLAAAVTTLDPLRGGLGDRELGALVYDTPLRLVDGRPQPHLALALDNPAGGLRARLVLRRDVRFSDGRLMTARDVAASLARALHEPGGWTLAPLRAVRAVGDDVVELDLARPAPDLGLLLTTPAAAVVADGDVRGRRVVGTGPFMVESWDANAVHLGANPSCFAGRAYLQALTLRGAGDRDEEARGFAVGALAAVRHAGGALAGAPRPGARVVDEPQTVTGVLAIGRGPDAERLRRALTLGIYRERLKRLVREPATVAVDNVNRRVDYDPRRARELVVERWGSERVALALLIDASRPDDRDLGARLLADAARLGLDVTLEVVPAAEYQARLEAGRYQLALTAVAPPARDPALAALGLLAVVDAAAARAALERAAAPAVDLEHSRVVPLYQRSTRVYVAPELIGLTVDALGRARWADAWWHPAR